MSYVTDNVRGGLVACDAAGAGDLGDGGDLDIINADGNGRIGLVGFHWLDSFLLVSEERLSASQL